MFKKIHFLMLLSTSLSLSLLAMEEGIIGENPPRKIVRILTIDGGGVRGAIPAKILALLEQRVEGNLRELGYSFDRINIIDFFDMIGGTSTGGIIAASLNSIIEHNGGNPKKASEILDIYRDLSIKIFPKQLRIQKIVDLAKPKYSQAPFKKILDDNFGKTELKSTFIPMVIPVYDMKSGVRSYFKSWLAKKYTDENFKMSEAILATAAAPTVYKSVKIRSSDNQLRTFADGGLFANNPLSAIFKAAREYFEPLYDNPNFFIISLGTGVEPTHDRLNLANAGTLKWASEIFDVISSNNEDNAEEAFNDFTNFMKSKNAKITYHRISPIIDSSIKELDKAENVEKLIGVAQRLINPASSQDKENCQKLFALIEEMTNFFKQKFIEKQLSELSLAQDESKMEEIKKN